MDKGVILLAFGKRGYGFMAYNLSLSIKHYSSNIPIHLIATREVLKEVTDHSVFDSIEWLESVPSDPGLFKAQIGRNLPFEHNLFLDVDAIALQSLEPLFQKCIESGVHYSTYIHEVYDIHSPNILPQMFWAYREDIWQHYGFDEHTRFPATQSSIQYIKKCSKTDELYDLFNEAFANPIPLERLRNKWGGGQPDELYLNVALAKQGDFKHIGQDSIWFGNDGSRRPHELVYSHYLLSYFGYRNNIRPMFWEYYDKVLQKMASAKGMRHIFKSHLLKGDKIANVQNDRSKTTRSNIGTNLIRVESQKFPKGEKRIVLFTHYFEQKFADRQRELRKVMEANINCASIDLIVNLGVPYSNQKVVNIEYNRPTYADFCKEAQRFEADYYIIANTDVYFTSEIEQINELEMDGKALCLSRWDVQTNGYAKLFNYEWSQDTWIFKGKPPLMEKCDFTMGLPACDNRFAYELAQKGIQPINPSLSIKTYHLHITNKRNYKEQDRLQGQVMPVQVEDWSKYRRKKVLIHQPGKVGDIIICLPIAEHYHKLGWIVEWLSPIQYHSLFNYVDYVKPVIAKTSTYDKVIDLSFGIINNTEVHRQWLKKRNNLDSFVQLKYEIASVPLYATGNLNYFRNDKLENSLYSDLGLDSVNDYILVHIGSDYGSSIDVHSDKTIVYFKPIEGKNYQIFDWRKVIENASEIHCIDSSLVNFVDRLPSVKGELHYYITDKVPHKSDRTLLSKKWLTYDLV